jgi:hypothetical protein
MGHDDHATSSRLDAVILDGDRSGALDLVDRSNDERHWVPENRSSSIENSLRIPSPAPSRSYVHNA